MTAVVDHSDASLLGFVWVFKYIRYSPGLTILERVVEEISFESTDRVEKRITIDARYVRERLDAVAQDEDLSRFIL